MAYIKSGVYPITEHQIRTAHPNISFPQVMLPEHVADFGYMQVESVAPIISDAEAATEGAPEQVHGAWRQTWVITPRPAPPAPSSVSMRQARLALLGAGLLAQVNAAIAAMQGVEGDAARIEWEYAADVRRNSALVSGLAGALGLTPAQLDDLFMGASKL